MATVPSPSPAATMLYEYVGPTCVIVHCEVSPTDSEWEAFLTAFSRQASSGALQRVLVYKDGIGPNSRQRARFQEVAKEFFRLSVPTAVLCKPGEAQGVSVAVGWFHRRHSSFYLNELTKALDFLELQGKARDEVADRLASLRERLARIRAPR